MVDMVNHPPHYEQQSIRVEPIDILQFAPFDLGCALKYIIRSKHKGNELQDLKKAELYLTWVEQNGRNVQHSKQHDWFSSTYGYLVKRFEGCEKMSSSIFCDVSDLLEEVQKRIAALERAKEVEK